MASGGDEAQGGDPASTVAPNQTGSGTVLDRPAPRVSAAIATPAATADIADEDHDEAVVTTARPSAAGSSTDARTTGSDAGKSQASTRSLVGSPIEALARAEILRTRVFGRVGLVIAVVAAVMLPFLPGGVVTTRIMLVSVVVAIAGLLYLLYRTRTPETFHEGLGIAIGWYVPAIAVTSAVPYFGPFSPVPILLVLGIFFTGLGSKFGLAAAIYFTSAAVQGVTAGLEIAGVSHSGFIHADDLSTQVKITTQVLIQFILLCTFIAARATRKSSLTTLGDLERAIRAVAQRQALLEEAREELRRALGSGRGRFTDQTLGHYQLGDVLGRGAMGEVYEGVDTRSNQPVAVKMLSQASLGNAHHVQRFLRELQTASTIDSPHVVRVLEVGEQPLPYLVMERLRGRDLSALLREKRGMSHGKLVDLVRQVGAGITAAGAVGVIHRDLKPQNVFLAGSTWKVLDFGVSRIADTGDTLTAGHIVGTPAYMAPEQARGATVDHRSDLYALAAIAYRVLTGHTPFSGNEIADTLYRVVHTAPQRPTRLAALPGDVDLALAIGLAKDPAHRFATAGALADALETALAGNLDEVLRRRGHTLLIDGAWAPSGLLPA